MSRSLKHGRGTAQKEGRSKNKTIPFQPEKNRHKKHSIEFSPCILIPSPGYIIWQNDEFSFLY